MLLEHNTLNALGTLHCTDDHTLSIYAYVFLHLIFLDSPILKDHFQAIMHLELFFVIEFLIIFWGGGLPFNEFCMFCPRRLQPPVVICVSTFVHVCLWAPLLESEHGAARV